MLRFVIFDKKANRLLIALHLYTGAIIAPPMLGAMIAPVLISVTLSPSGPPVCHNLTYYIVRLYCVPIQILDQSWIIRRTQWRKTQSLIFIP